MDFSWHCSFDRALAREDRVQGAELADLQPTGIHTAIADRSMGLREVEGVRATSPTQIPPVTAGVELPARLEQAAMTLQGKAK
jgi:hypothetical protein